MKKIDVAIDEHFSQVFEACRRHFGHAWWRSVLQNYHLSRVIRAAEEAGKDEDALEGRTSDCNDGTVSETEFVNSCSLYSERTGSEFDSVSPTRLLENDNILLQPSEAMNDASVTVNTQPSDLNLSPSEKRM